MKWTPLILGLALLATVSAAHATEEDRWNVMTNPLLLLLGPNVQVDYRLEDHWTVGPQVFYVNRTLGDYDLRAFSAGVNANYYFATALTHSWFVQGGAGYSSVHLEGDDSKYGDRLSGSSSGVYAKGVGGYHWFWGDFNLRLGAGVTYQSSRVVLRDRNGDQAKASSGASLSLAGEASLGWTF